VDVGGTIVTKKYDNPAVDAAEKVRESAQQIWLAGLGAFAKAQQEGSKVFEALVQDGVNLQRKTQAVAQERMAEATERITEMADGLSSKAGQQWGRLEGIFEERVARAMSALGAPSASELQALSERVQTLEQQVRALSKPPASRARAKASGQAVARKTPSTPRKTPARRKNPG
jgi:poly(hydroxyalkanoate) granule-associated protein